jgi:hypothetical protein
MDIISPTRARTWDCGLTVRLRRHHLREANGRGASTGPSAVLAGAGWAGETMHGLGG